MVHLVNIWCVDIEAACCFRAALPYPLIGSFKTFCIFAVDAVPYAKIEASTWHRTLGEVECHVKPLASINVVSISYMTSAGLILSGPLSLLGRCGLMPALRSSFPMPSVWAPWHPWGATTSTNTTATGEKSVFRGRGGCGVVGERVGVGGEGILVCSLTNPPHDICVT